MHADATTPAENQPVRSSLSSQPVGGLPLITGGSASALTVSRPARRSLAFRPAWSLSRPGRPFCPRCFSPCRYLHEPPWPLPAGATVAGWDSHPPGKRAFPRRTVMLSLQCGHPERSGPARMHRRSNAGRIYPRAKAGSLEAPQTSKARRRAVLFRDEHPANGGASPVYSHLNEVHPGRNLLAMSVPTVPMGFVAAGGGVFDLEQRQSFSAAIS